MLAPALVDDLEHDVALERPRSLRPAGHGGVPLLIELEGLGQDGLGDLLGADRLGKVLGHEGRRVVLVQVRHEGLEVPVLREVSWTGVSHDRAYC